MAEQRLTDLRVLKAAAASGTVLFYAVVTGDTTDHPSGSGYQISLQELKNLLGVDIITGNKSKQGHYDDIPSMLSDQENQTIGKVQFVEDASLFVPPISGPAYFEFTGPATAQVSNYKKLSAAEVESLEHQENKGLYQIGDYMVDRRGGKNTTIKKDNIIYGIGSFLPTEYLIAVAKKDDPTTLADFTIIKQTLLEE